MTYQEHDRGGQEPPLHREHTSWPRLKEKMLRRADQYERLRQAEQRVNEVQESYEAGYRQAISDLEAWHEPPELTTGVSYAIDHLSERADEYWPQEEIT